MSNHLITWLYSQEDINKCQVIPNQAPMIYPSAMPLQICKLRTLLKSLKGTWMTQRKAAFHECFSLEWRMNEKHSFFFLLGQLEDSSTKESSFFPHSYYSLDNPRESPYKSCNFPSQVHSCKFPAVLSFWVFFLPSQAFWFKHLSFQ